MRESAMADDASGKQPRPYRGDLTALDAATSMQAARLTALDLLDTAEILYSLKRFQHSAALSTLAIEEAGKLPLLLMIFLGFGNKVRFWQSYRVHKAKTAGLNLGIEARIRVTFPDIPAPEARELGQQGPSPDDLETAKQRAFYSDCLETDDGFVCHLPRNIDWRHDAWGRLCEAKALVSVLRDYPPDELDVWLKHAKAAQDRGFGYKQMLEPLHAELLAKGYLKEGQWAALLKTLHEYEADGEAEA
jgi:AbiV family abortive infection protein